MTHFFVPQCRIYLLQKIYAQLDEPDGVSGILATQNQSPTLQQLVLAHEVNGQLQVLLDKVILF